MTVEEKAKAYDEALEKFKKFKEKYFTFGRMGFGDVICDKTGTAQDELDAIFPQLRESEDERIRKRLIEYFEGFMLGKVNVKWEGLCVEGILAWLEKQKEQKPAEWSEIEVEFRGEKVKVKRPFFRDDKGHGYSTTEQDDWVTWDALRAWAESHGYTPFDLYPRAEWSEEDEKMLNDILGILHSTEDAALANFSEQKKWLKSLHPQPKVEWSEEDEEVMEDLYNFVISDFIQDHIHETRWKPWKTTLERNRQNRLKSLRPSWKPSDK